MPRIIAKSDTLNDENKKFLQKPLDHTVFINSVPKSGTHLIRNILRMFVPIEQQYDVDFIQFPNLGAHRQVFLDKENPKLAWGHLLFADTPAMLLKDLPHILLVRDPYDWVLARTRFFLSDNFQANLEHLKHGAVNIDDYMNMMIFGIYNKIPTLEEIFTNNAVSWLGTSAYLMRYEELISRVKNLDSAESEAYFDSLFQHCKIEKPKDWKRRIEIGSDRKQSGTARENLDLGGQVIPEKLPEKQKRLVDYAAPGLRQLLGYA